MEKLKKYKYWIAFVVVLLLFIVLNPSQSQHAQKIASDNMLEEKSDSGDENVVANGFAVALISSFSTYHNYLFFSTCTAENEGESHLVSIGALGYVYYIPQNKDKESE